MCWEQNKQNDTVPSEMPPQLFPITVLPDKRSDIVRPQVFSDPFGEGSFAATQVLIVRQGFDKQESN